LDPDPRVPRPLPSLPDDAHKGTAGRVLCVVGSAEMPGAALLVARAAQRAGAGLVIAGCLDRVLLRLVPLAAPEAVLLDLADDFHAGGGSPAAAAERLLDRAPHARLIGCGLGAVPRTREVVRRALEDGSDGAGRRPLVLDADALNVLAGEPERLRASPMPIVITPHPGEAGRLLGRSVPAGREGRAAAARELALRSGAIVVLKGAGTVVTDGARTFRNTTGNSGMATAGAGDLLAGVIVAYAALCSSLADAAWEPFDAAARAVLVHGLAGDLAAATLGRRALVASDLVAHLPEAQRRTERASAASDAPPGP
jgi:NAD(P)H-hydrate epimerase